MVYYWMFGLINNWGCRIPSDSIVGRMPYLQCSIRKENRKTFQTQRHESEKISSCAGHEYPVFYRKRRGFVPEQDPHGLTMGAMEGSNYCNAQWHLDPGDMLFLYADGVPEANNGNQELFGEKRMLDELERSMQAASLNAETEKTDLKLFLHTLRAALQARRRSLTISA